jgi:hypothetical protein
MIFLKKLLILVTVIIFLIIIWRLLIIRINLKKDLEGFSIPIPFLSPIKDNEVSNNQSTSQVTIKNINNNLYNLPLRELCIKSSFNSACSGSFINLDMLQYVINRGCRYLDFEVFYILSDTTNSKTFIPVVSTSVDSTYMILNSENSILLDNVLSSAVSNAFSSPCPNYKDPLFINLRVKSNNTNVYSAIATSIDNSIQQKIYNDTSKQVYTGLGKTINPAMPVTNNTLISDILGKVIISFDKSIYPNYVNYTSTCDASNNSACYDLKNYINIENSSENMNLYMYSLITQVPLLQISDNNVTTNVKTIQCVNPDNLYLMNKSNANPNYGDYILKYGGCQIVPYRFYQNDSNLMDYENFFSIHNSAFVPLSIAISQYKKEYQ